MPEECRELGVLQLSDIHICTLTHEYVSFPPRCLSNETSVLLLYSLVHGNSNFLEYVLVRTDVDTLVRFRIIHLSNEYLVMIYSGSLPFGGLPNKETKSSVLKKRH